MPLLGPLWHSSERDKPEDEGLDDRTKRAIRLENNKKTYGGGFVAIRGRATRAGSDGARRGRR